MLRINQYTHAHFAKYCLFICGKGSSVSIATNYGLDGLGSNLSLLAVIEREGCAVKHC